MPILCLESNWDGKRPSNQSVAPVIETLVGLHADTAIHLWCNTAEELTHNLRHMTYGFRQGTLYLSFHGTTGKILLGNGAKVSLYELADLMGSRFAGWKIHFGSCRTLASLARDVFKYQTGATILSGYTETVDWIQSMAMDMFLMNESYRYTRPHNLRKRMEKLVPDLMKLTGAVIL